MVVAPEPWLQEEDEWAQEPVFVQPAPPSYVSAGGGGSYAAGGVISSGNSFTSALRSPSAPRDDAASERVDTHISLRPDGTYWYEIRGRGAVGGGAGLAEAQQEWAAHRAQGGWWGQQETVRRVYTEGNQRQVTEAAASMQRAVEESTTAVERFNRQLAYLQNVMVEYGFTEEERARVQPALVEAVRRSNGNVDVTVTGRTRPDPQVQ